MKRLAICLLLIGGGLGMSARPTLACINDRETRVHENHFKSNYPQDSSSSEESSQPAPEVGFTLGSVGLLMLSVAAAIVYLRKT
ncbi:MAG: hypothetical protein K8T25_23535 [Planctomycetia bacterium]|nr:hypothetical protein [Planctomycetia bacterium]